MKMVLKIGKYRAPPFLVGGKGENYVLQVPHISSDYPFDKPAKLEVLDSFPFIAFLSAEDVRGTSDGSPSYMKYIFYSYSLSENKKIMTSYLTYTFTGPIIVKA